MELTENSDPQRPQATIDADDAGRTIITLRGEIDLADVDDLERLLTPRLQPDDTVVFDLSGVDFMDTSGIALLLEMVNAVSDAEIRAPSKQVRRVLEASGLTSVLRVVP
jgi:anti-sigma B factor antagonist